MIIDQSPMSAFLEWALFLVGIPAIIFSIIIGIKLTRSFFGDRDYNLENPEHASEGTNQTATSHEDKSGGESSVHRSNASRDAIKARMIQSG